MTLGAEGPSWAAATPHTQATDAAAAAFEHGGTAVDAALAAAVTLAVTYPQACGVGGDLFALVQHEDGRVFALNASGRALAGIDPSIFGGGSMPDEGPLTVTVPGAVSGWETLHRIGAELPWRDAFDRAIALAYGGVTVPRATAASLAGDAQRLGTDRGMREVFFPDGSPLAGQAQLRQPALGASLEAIAAGGAKALYGGDVGRRYAEGLRAAGVPIVLDDLARHEADVVPALRGRYRDLDVSVVPPNSQGFVLLEILELVERLGIDPDPLGPDAGTLALAIRAAGRDRDEHLADPDHMRVHPATLLDDGHLAGLADEVRDGLIAPAAPGAGDTIGLVTADARGWAVSLIQSLSSGFGSGILEPETGILAQDRGADFTLDPDHPNMLAPGKRPAHTLTPVLAHRAGRLAGAAGTRGGNAQPQINAGNLVRAFALGFSPEDAVSAPRWLVDGMDRERPGEPPFVIAEADVPAVARTSLEAAGFRIDDVGRHDHAAGHAHLIRVEQDGGFAAGSDPRADGGAAAG